MDRAESEQLYRQEMEFNNQEISDFFQKVAQTDNKLQKFKFINRAQQLSQVNKLLNEQYKIIAQKEGPPARISESDLQAKLSEVKELISVSIQPELDEDALVHSLILESVGKIGFKVIDRGGDLNVLYRFQKEKANMNRPGTTALNWQINIEVQDNINKKAMDAFNVNNRTVALNEQAAELKMKHNLKKIILEEFTRQLFSYLN
jgi:hypothetical protein